MRVRGKVWVVTGAGAGMGRQLVRALVARGGRVAAVDLREGAVRETAAMVGAGGAVSAHVVDVTDRAATEALVGEVLSAHGAVDGVINNAGISQPFVPVAGLDYEAVHRVLDVNLMGTLHMVKSFLPALLERPEAHLANVSSMGGFAPFPGQTVYGASKAAVLLLTQGLYAELRDTSVAVSAIMPGVVRTDIAAHSGVAAPAMGAAGTRWRMTTADAAAGIMLDGIERGRLHIYVGKEARLMNLAMRLAPRAAIGLVQRQMKRLTEPAAP
jgi:NAD(P)-dependent dehydrogenase (short-subunit alcohol dehydrogenase family)